MNIGGVNSRFELPRRPSLLNLQHGRALGEHRTSLHRAKKRLLPRLSSRAPGRPQQPGSSGLRSQAVLERRSASPSLGGHQHGPAAGIRTVIGTPLAGKTRPLEALLSAAREQGCACHTGLVLDFGTASAAMRSEQLARDLLALSANAGEDMARAATQQVLASVFVERDD